MYSFAYLSATSATPGGVLYVDGDVRADGTYFQQTGRITICAPMDSMDSVLCRCLPRAAPGKYIEYCHINPCWCFLFHASFATSLTRMCNCCFHLQLSLVQRSPITDRKYNGLYNSPLISSSMPQNQMTAQASASET